MRKAMHDFPVPAYILQIKLKWDNTDMSISTDKKLELLRDIRTENQRNRQLMQHRQQLLGGFGVMEIPEKGNINRDQAASSGIRGLRLRIFVSFLLLGGYIVANKLEWHYQEIDCSYVMQQINRTVSFEQLLSDGKALLDYEKAGIK